VFNELFQAGDGDVEEGCVRGRLECRAGNSAGREFQWRPPWVARPGNLIERETSAPL